MRAIAHSSEHQAIRGGRDWRSMGKVRFGVYDHSGGFVASVFGVFHIALASANFRLQRGFLKLGSVGNWVMLQDIAMFFVFSCWNLRPDKTWMIVFWSWSGQVSVHPKILWLLIISFALATLPQLEYWTTPGDRFVRPVSGDLDNVASGSQGERLVSDSMRAIAHASGHQAIRAGSH